MLIQGPRCPNTPFAIPVKLSSTEVNQFNWHSANSIPSWSWKHTPLALSKPPLK